MKVNNLKALLSENNVTQRDVAVALGLSQQRFNYYVNGQREPDAETLCAIADYFSVSLDYLLGRDSAPLEIIKAPSPEDDALLDLFHQLNGEGQEKALDLLDDLVQSGKYIKSHSARLDQEA